MRADNLFASLPDAREQEAIDNLLARPGCRIERIVSRGQRSAEGFWYDQDEDEWVLLLAGAARLEICGESGEMHLSPGDHVFLPAGLRHRVNWTSTDPATIWLAVFCAAADEPRCPAEADLRPD